MNALLTPLPVAGYTAQTEEDVALVNRNKALEEMVLRQIDAMTNNPHYDGRMISLARTKLQESFMWLNRSVFKPGRVLLPGEEEIPTQRPDVDDA